MIRIRRSLGLFWVLLLPGLAGCLPQQLEPAAVISLVATATLPAPLITLMPQPTETSPPTIMPQPTQTQPATPTPLPTISPTATATSTIAPTATVTPLPMATMPAVLPTPFPLPTFTPEMPAPTAVPADATVQPFDCYAVNAVPLGECLALLDLYQAANGWGWQHTDGWLATTDPCTWYGITCTEGRVVGIDLSNNQLTGVIPSSLGSLEQLTFLGLNVNQLSGEIPAELGNLTRLNYLYLSVNQLQGSIPPQLGQLSELRALWLGYNQLSGALPPEMGQMTQLFQLFVSDNQLSGSLPAELGNLRSLLELSVAENAALAGPLPNSLLELHLATFQYQDTGLCAPGDADFQVWLAAIGGLMGNGLVCP